MSAIGKITEIYLLSVPLEPDYKHTFSFNSPEEQTQYFYSKRVNTGVGGTNFSYLRKEGIIRFPVVYDRLMNCNYVMYRNADYGNGTKWFYAFITEMEYKNDDLTEIRIETDVIQTWFFDYNMLPSFVEREHVRDDTIGKHTLPEGLETGPYIINTVNTFNKMRDSVIVIGSTVNFNDADFKFFEPGEVKKYNIDTGDTYGNVFSGVTYYIVSASQAQKLISSLANTGQSDAIVSVFMAPKCMLSRDPNYNPETQNYETVKASTTPVHIPWSTDSATGDVVNKKPTGLDGYIPKNNKLLTHPYAYLLMSNNSGASAIYKYEDFKYSTEYCSFEIYGTVSPGMSIRLLPFAYNGYYAFGETDNNLVFAHEEGLTLGKFPICSWANDVYTNWLTQNSVNNTVSIATGLAMTAIGVASIAAAIPSGGSSVAAGTAATSALAGAGGVVGGVSAIGGTVGQINAHSMQPPQAEGNTNSGDVTFASGNLTFTAYCMTIKNEYARIIDNFFSMFGYKVSDVHIPNKNHRESYWYTKTIDANIDGAIPATDLQKIKNCYNAGITFWKNRDNIGDYSVSNEITV